MTKLGRTAKDGTQRKQKAKRKGGKGFRYLPRAKKPKHDKKQREERCRFASKSEAAHIFLDGVDFTMRTSGAEARESYCTADVSFVWRRPVENKLPDEARYTRYAKQVPKECTTPLWDWLGPSGVTAVLWHADRKTNQHERAGAMLTKFDCEGTRGLPASRAALNCGPFPAPHSFMVQAHDRTKCS